jgi:hypothetical protein
MFISRSALALKHTHRSVVPCTWNPSIGEEDNSLQSETLSQKDHKHGLQRLLRG